MGVIIFLLSFSLLSVVQAKEVERRRQHRAGAACISFLVGPFAAFLSYAVLCCSSMFQFFPQPTAASSTFTKTLGFAASEGLRSEMPLKRHLEHQCGADLQHAAAFPSPQCLQHLRHGEENASLTLSAADLICQMLYGL